MSMTTKKAMILAEEYTKAWCSHQAATVASFYAEDGKIIINGGEPSTGRAEIEEMAQAFYDDFPDLIVRMDSFRTSGTHAVFLWTLEGTHSGTGNYVKVSGWEYWRFSEDSLVAESAGHFDADDYQRQVDGM